MRKWDGLKEGEWVEMGREGRDAYGERETYNIITLECIHLILQFEYKCSSNESQITSLLRPFYTRERPTVRNSSTAPYM